MLTMPTDYLEADTALEIFSQFNATPIVCTNTERFGRAPLNMVVKVVTANGFNALTNVEVGVDFSAGTKNGFYGKSYSSFDGVSFFPLLSLPKAPLYSLVSSFQRQTSEYACSTHACRRQFVEATVYPEGFNLDNNAAYYRNVETLTLNDTSWQINDALFDRYYLSGMAPVIVLIQVV